MKLVEIPEDSESEVPIEALIARQVQRFELAKARWKRAGRRQVKMPPGPFAIVHFGDPHIDDDGADWPALLRCVETVNNTEGMYAANGGDTTNRWVGFLQAKYGEQAATKEDENRLADWLLGATQWIYVLLGNHDCLRDTVECYTRRGWVQCWYLQLDDEVLQLHPDTGEAVWGGVRNIIRRDHVGQLVSVNTPWVSVAMTPNHRVLHRTGKNRAKFGSAETLPRTFSLPLAGRSLQRPADYTDDEVRGMAETLPPTVETLSAGQFDVLIAAIVERYGAWLPKEGKAQTAATIYASDGYHDRLQGLCARYGWAGAVHPGGRMDLKKTSWGHATSKTQVRMERYVGSVWCLTVEHGNFLVRENGKAHFTGNCWNNGEQLLKQFAEGKDVAVIAPDEIRLELLSPDGPPCRIHARHDFPGHSLWNSAHAPMRASKLDGWAHIYIAFHRHSWVDHREEGADGVIRWALRARGFKRFDSYARRLGLHEQEHGECLITVHDPGHRHPGERVRVMLDVEEAAETLQWLRRRAGY